MGNVILIGFMGCGKSSIAVKLSYRMKQSMVDTDRWIEKKQGKTITEIFAQDGEEAFRKMETDALEYLKEKAKNQIISVGGGLPVREENRKLMKEIGKVVYLRATAETIYDRVKEDGARPLLQCENPKERIIALMDQRKEAYESAADLIVDVDGKNFGQILFEIERGLRPLPRQAMPLPGVKYERSGYRQGGYNSYYGNYQPRNFENVQNAEATSTVASNAASVTASVDTEMEQENMKLAAAEKTEAVQNSVSAHEENVNSSVAACQPAEEKEPVNVAAPSETAETQERRLKKLLVINGPNLNFLGIREKSVYGTKDYNYLLDMIARKGLSCKASIDVFQSNHEGAIIDRIQAAYFDGTDGIVINPGAYTHYSYAIHDALASITVPKVEVHISNIMEREAFRRVSVTAPACDKQIYGHGLEGYLEAIDFIMSDVK